MGEAFGAVAFRTGEGDRHDSQFGRKTAILPEAHRVLPVNEDVNVLFRLAYDADKRLKQG